MTDEKRLKLENAGVDVAGVMERFLGNEALLERFMKKFMDDANYKKLREAIERKEMEEAFAASHTLKGVCGNLSLMKLLDPVSRQCEMLRSGDMEGATAIMPEVVQEYESIIGVIQEVFP